MRLTKQELEDITGSSNLNALVELNLASKHVHELGHMANLTQLQDVNLAFNELRELEGGLARCKGLRVLNLMHNKLRSLGGLEGLPELCCLRAGCNRIGQLSGLATLPKLQELWLQGNRLRDVTKVAAELKKLPLLLRLVLKPNPCCGENEEDAALCRQYLLSELRGLEQLDASKVENGEREAADAYLASADGKAALAAMLERISEAGIIASRPGSGRAKGRAGKTGGSGRRGQDSGDEGDGDEERGSRPLGRGQWVRGMSEQERKRKQNAKKKQAREQRRREQAEEEEVKASQQSRRKPRQKQRHRQQPHPDNAAAGGGDDVAPAPAMSVQEEIDPILANAKRLLAGMDATADAPPSLSAAAAQSSPQADPPASGEGEEEAEGGDPVLANAKQLLAGLNAAMPTSPFPSPSPPSSAKSGGGNDGEDEDNSAAKTLVEGPRERARRRRKEKQEEQQVAAAVEDDSELGALASLRAAIAALNSDPSNVLSNTSPGQTTAAGSAGRRRRRRGGGGGGGRGGRGGRRERIDTGRGQGKQAAHRQQRGRGGRGGQRTVHTPHDLGDGGAEEGGGEGGTEEKQEGDFASARRKRHSAPAGGTPRSLLDGDDAADRPGTGGTLLPQLPSRGHAQFTLRYTSSSLSGRVGRVSGGGSRRRQQGSEISSKLGGRWGNPPSSADETASRSGGADGGGGGGRGGSDGAVGVVVRYDGSAVAKYPNGSLAVSVDLEGGGVESGEPPQYRLYAAFRGSGAVAASFDSDGNGFANCKPTIGGGVGSKGGGGGGGGATTCFTTNRDSGGFTSKDGGVDERWGPEWADEDEKENAEAAGGGAPQRVITKQLDDHLCLRYIISGGCRATELLFRCSNVKHRFVLGRNPTMGTWEPGDDAAFAPVKRKKAKHQRNSIPLGTASMLSSTYVAGEYTVADKLSDISSIMGGLDQLTAHLNTNGV